MRPGSRTSVWPQYCDCFRNGVCVCMCVCVCVYVYVCERECVSVTTGRDGSRHDPPHPCLSNPMYTNGTTSTAPTTSDGFYSFELVGPVCGLWSQFCTASREGESILRSLFPVWRSQTRTGSNRNETTTATTTTTK